MLPTGCARPPGSSQELGPSDPTLPNHESQKEQGGEQRAHSEGDGERMNQRGRLPHGWLRRRTWREELAGWRAPPEKRPGA
jgi:hypothetical protein